MAMPDAPSGTRQALGQRAEGLAACYLEGLGYTVVARNWRRPTGELDLVVTKDRLCVFVEVRSRTGVERGHALETVDARKCARVRRAARLFLDQERPSADVYRFDVVGVTFAPEDGAPELVHIEDAFRAD